MPNMIKFLKDINTLFYFSIILLSSLILLSFYNLYGMTAPFPFKVSDVSGHMGMFYFLLKYGFHSWVPNWYGGFTLFLYYPPLFSYYVLPFYSLLGSIPLAFYFAIISTYILLFVAVYFLCKTQKFSLFKTVIFFLVVFATRFGLGMFFEGGRVGESIGWVFFTLLFTIIMYYRDRPLDKNFMLAFVPTISLMVLSHVYFAIFGSMLILPFMLIKKRKDIIIIISSIITSLVLTSFWWFPFITSYINEGGNKDLLFASINSLGILNRTWIITVPILFWACFYLYFKEKKDKKDLYLMLPFIILSVLFFTGIASYIPVLSEISLHSYSLIFIFMAMFYFLKKDSYKGLPEKFIIISVAVILPIVTTIAYLNPLQEFFFVDYNNRPLFKEVISVMPNISGKFLVVPNRDETSLGYFFGGAPILCYATIYYNLSTPAGFTVEVTSERTKKLEEFDKMIVNGDCSGISTLGKELAADEILSYEHYCGNLKKCSELKMKIEMEHICLFDVVKD